MSKLKKIQFQCNNCNKIGKGIVDPKTRKIRCKHCKRWQDLQN